VTRSVVIVQARMTSTRLPGKVLADVAGRPLLAQLIGRLRAATQADEIMIATTSLKTDDAVEALARNMDVRCFRGDEHDVLGRYWGAARESKADIVTRVTGDCPLVDAAETDRVIRALREAPNGADYASNVMTRTYPRGLETEVFHMDVLERVARFGRSAEAREHVTWFISRERPDLFVRVSIEDEQDNSDLRWTVDTPEDLEMVRRVYEGLALGETRLPYRQVLAYVRSHPEISAINAGVVQKHG
jgi:spore coat polysaccharide biosynthesis protein SpsF